MKNKKKTWYKAILLTLMLTLSLGSCSTDDQLVKEDKQLETVVYALTKDKAEGKLSYWKDTKQVPMIGGVSFIYDDFSIQVIGNNVYTFAYRWSNPIYWKNGLSVDLTQQEKIYSLKEIRVDANDIYTLARLKLDNNRDYVYMKNNEAPVKLEVPHNSWIRSIADMQIVGGNCYILGEYSTEDSEVRTIALWENGRIIQIQMYLNEEYWMNLQVADNSIYIIGTRRLKDGSSWYDSHIMVNVWNIQGNIVKSEDVDKDFRVERIVFSQGKLHLLGIQSVDEQHKLVYMIDGKIIWSIEHEMSFYAVDLVIHGDDTYIMGNVGEKATIWKNNEIIWQVDNTWALGLAIGKESGN